MAGLGRSTLPAVDAHDGLTIDDIDDMPENLRVELHNGDLVVRPPGMLWHEKVVEAIVVWFTSQNRFAATNPGIKWTRRDTRVPDVGVFYQEPVDWSSAHHEPSELEIVIEVWSRSSDEKDHHEMQWYADRDIPEYWLVTPIEGQKAGCAHHQIQADHGRRAAGVPARGNDVAQ